MRKKPAFTLTELLIALGIVGAIAALAIPSLLTTINNRLLVTQLKNNVGEIQQLAADQLVVHRAKSLKNTDFSSPEVLNDFDTRGTGTFGTKLKNGAEITYAPNNLQFGIDVNGSAELPNKAGRDIFYFCLDTQGSLASCPSGDENFQAVVSNGWKMPDTNYPVSSSK